ncbi:hypothetical protein [Caryophanon latum]|uniref:Uncharacterized protein n=1 Tax=Caryophanon latum TaxID=33977 RepID=A0A1C0YV72_9BACL|nr:hypothetical protein [Caryophanon latum]OCS91034.1 hypothetical protein A6K76_09830 [Caryophanon latum]
MLNFSSKKEAIEQLKREMDLYNLTQKVVQQAAIDLHQTRELSIGVIDTVELYVNTLAHTPKSFDKDFKQIQLNMASFKALRDIEYDEKTMQKMVGGGIVGGVAAGGAIAALAPSAVMAFATTFGTASTGAAISSLSGAAATNAALAWIGGGAVAAGGGGMAAGNMLLAFAGPIGWSIGVGSLVVGGVLTSKKNKEAALKADQERLNVIVERHKLQALQHNIDALNDTTSKLMHALYKDVTTFRERAAHIDSYEAFSLTEREQLLAIVNNTLALSALFMKDVVD